MSTKSGATLKFIDEAFAMETDECILWPFSLHPRGYPNAKDANGIYKPTRRICEMQHGPAPTPKHHAAHECGNKACINKRHLNWKTPKDNEADKRTHGTDNRAPRIIGIGGAVEVRNRAAQGEPLTDIAKGYGVTYQAIKKIVDGKTYQFA